MQCHLIELIIKQNDAWTFRSKLINSFPASPMAMELKYLPFMQAFIMAMHNNNERLIVSAERQELDMLFHSKTRGSEREIT